MMKTEEEEAAKPPLLYYGGIFHRTPYHTASSFLFACYNSVKGYAINLYGMVMTAFGIVAIVTSVLGIITPTLGLLLSGLSGFFALFSLRYKDPFAQASLVLNCLNLTLLSPLTVASIFSDYALFAKTTQNLKIMYWLILFIQSIGLVLWYIYSKEDDKEEAAQLVDKPKERIEPRL